MSAVSGNTVEGANDRVAARNQRGRAYRHGLRVLNKEWAEVIFGNANGLSAEKVAARAEKHLIDRLWFVADKVGLPGLFAYPYDPESGKR